MTWSERRDRQSVEAERCQLGFVTAVCAECFDVIILVHFTSLHKVHLTEISFMPEGKNILLKDFFWSMEYCL